MSRKLLIGMGCFTVWILITQLVLARSSTRWPSLVCMQCLRPYIHGSLVESKVAVYYSNTYWGLAYSGSINPVEEANIDVYKFGVDGEDGHLLPPATRRPPGRPRKARIPSRGEFKVSIFGVIFLLYLLRCILTTK